MRACKPNADYIRLLSGGLILLLLATVGCGGGSTLTLNEEQMARGYLPPTRELPHPPDSLVHLTIVEKDNRFAFMLDRSYQEIASAWSASWQPVSGGAFARDNARFRSFATLWSLELSLASLISERGIEQLSKELARKLIRKRKDQYGKLIRFHVYRFAHSPYAYVNSFTGVQLDTPGTQLLLRDAAGNEYAPVRVEAAIPREAFLAGESVLYARNLVLFERFVDGKDLLDDIEHLELVVNELRTNTSYVFTWTAQ